MEANSNPVVREVLPLTGLHSRLLNDLSKPGVSSLEVSIVIPPHTAAWSQATQQELSPNGEQGGFLANAKISRLNGGTWLHVSEINIEGRAIHLNITIWDDESAASWKIGEPIT